MTEEELESALRWSENLAIQVVDEVFSHISTERGWTNPEQITNLADLDTLKRALVRSFNCKLSSVEHKARVRAHTIGLREGHELGKAEALQNCTCQAKHGPNLEVVN
jgi:hypothetical protein